MGCLNGSLATMARNLVVPFVTSWSALVLSMCPLRRIRGGYWCAVQAAMPVAVPAWLVHPAPLWHVDALSWCRRTWVCAVLGGCRRGGAGCCVLCFLFCAYHLQSNGAAERLVATIKSILAAKVAGATHDWPSLLPQLRMEYMQRVHSATGYSPNRLVFAVQPRLPPPVGALHWNARSASSRAAAPTPQSECTTYVSCRDECSHDLFELAYDRILARQHRHAAQQKARRLRRRTGGKPLQVGDFAYSLTRSGGFKS